MSQYRWASMRFADDFADMPLGEPDALMARTWALGVPRNVSKIVGTMYEDARHFGIVTENNFTNLRLPATEKTAEVAPPTDEDLQKLLGACLIFGGTFSSFLRPVGVLRGSRSIVASIGRCAPIKGECDPNQH